MTVFKAPGLTVFGTGDGTQRVFRLGEPGQVVTSADIREVAVRGWQGEQKMYPHPRTNLALFSNDFANPAWAGSPSLVLDFARTQRVPSIVTFTRSTGGGRFNAQGQYEWLPANTPRIDYDPVTGECRGLLTEEQRTNLLTYSNDFSNAAWNKVGATVTPSAAMGPDGTMTASLLQESTASGLHNTYRNAISVTVGAAYSATIFAKPASGSRILRLASFGHTANIDLVSMEYNVFGSTAFSVSVSRAPNGFVRVALRGVVPPLSPSNIYISLAQSLASASNDYTGDGESGIYIWGAQLEAGAFPTSYIPTTDAQVTRAADIASVNELSPWYRADEGTLFVEFVPMHMTTGANWVASLSNSGTGTNDLIDVSFAANGSVRGRVITGGSGPSSTTVSGIVKSGAVTRATVAFKADDLICCANGVLGGRQAPSSLPIVNRLQIGRVGVFGYSPGHIRSIRYFPRRLSDAELQALTA